MCATGDVKVYEFSVSLKSRRYHTVGVAPEACCADVNTYHSSAALYSHTASWKGDGSPSYEKWWKGTRDGASRILASSLEETGRTSAQE